MSARAFGREDKSPSAAINVRTGRYKEFSGGGKSLSFFDFCVEASYGKFLTWRDARKHYAERARLPLPKGRGDEGPDDQIEPVGTSASRHFHRHAQGVLPEERRHHS
jgi:hypothetical protein